MKEDTDAIANCFADAIAGDPISKAALEKKADTPNESGETILHVESKKGVIENVQFIVKEFANKSLLGKLDRSKQTALHLAADLGHTEVVEVLVYAARRNLMPSSANDDAVSGFHAFIRQATAPKRNTALHIAVNKGNVDIVKLLVEADPSDRHIPNDEGKTPIYMAAEKGYNDIIKVICTTCTALCLDGPGGSTTALHAAAYHGHTQVVEVLIDAARHLPSSSANEDVHNPVSSFQDFIRKATDPMRNTALHLAVLYGNVAIVKLLVEADPNDNHVQNNEGKTPIYIAAENGYKDIVKEICTTCTALSLDGPGGRTTALHALIKKLSQVTEGASDVIGMMVRAAKRWSSAEDASLVKFEALFSRTDESESTVLQLAVERNYVDAVRLILLEDPAYQPGREIKRNGLMRLIFKAIDKEYSEAIDKEYSDDIIKLLSETYKAGIDPVYEDVLALILSIKRRDKDSVLRLLGDAKNLVTFREDNDWTPLHYAVYLEFDSILGAIIEAQENVRHQFVYANMESTPFYVAVKHGYTSTVIRLMQSWPTPSSVVTAPNCPYTIVNDDDQNILHLAAVAEAAENRKEMVQGILRYCPEKYKDKILKQQDINGNTPLHLLIYHGCYISEVIKMGLDTMVTNKRGFTPLDMLYLETEIAGDQAQIKNALDDMQTNQWYWKKIRRSLKKDISESLVLPSRRERKDVLFNERIKLLTGEQMEKDLQIYRQGTSSQIVVSALITTITFTVGFTMPGGLHQGGEDEGMVVLSKKAAFNAFIVLDALALLLSACSMFIYFLASIYEDPYELFSLHATTTVLNMVSVMLMMLIFITGTYVVLSQSPALAITVCVIGSLFFLFVIVHLMKIVCGRRREKKNKD